jgi:hypothetical protein
MRMALIRCKSGHLFSEKKHGKICPYCNISTDPVRIGGEEDPLGMYADKYLADLGELKPVVGWLVCRVGPARGKDFRLVSGKNFLGRALDMDIRVVGDDDISLRNHAVFIYDPEDNKTFVKAGEDSKGLVYAQGNSKEWERISEQRELSAGERMKIGQSEFLFVPFCGYNIGFEFPGWSRDDGDKTR